MVLKLREIYVRDNNPYQGPEVVVVIRPFTSARQENHRLAVAVALVRFEQHDVDEEEFKEIQEEIRDERRKSNEKQHSQVSKERAS